MESLKATKAREITKENVIELARDNMAQAEEAFRNYLRSGECNPEQEKQFANAVKVSMDESVDQLEKLFPRM